MTYMIHIYYCISYSFYTVDKQFVIIWQQYQKDAIYATINKINASEDILCVD